MFTTSRVRFGNNASRGSLALLVLSLLAGSSHTALAQAAPPLPDTPLEIPLDIVGESTKNSDTNPTNPYPDETSTGYRLGINIGLADAPPREYILDTGSTAFNVDVGSNYNVGAGVPWFDRNASGPIKVGYPLYYGDGTYGNNVSSTTLPSITFYDVTGKKVATYESPAGIPLSLNTGTFATKASLGVNQAGALAGYFVPNRGAFTLDEIVAQFATQAKFLKRYSHAVPMYINQSQQDAIDKGQGPFDLPASTRFFGIFGAGDFGNDSALGGLTTTGYVVAANGEVGADHDCDTTCAHVTLNLTPAIRAQFTNVLPWKGGTAGTFPMSGAPVSGDQYDTSLAYTLSDGKTTVSATLPTLLDSGTGSYTFSDNQFLADIKKAGFFDATSTANDAGTGNASGNIISGLTLSANSIPLAPLPTAITTGNEYYGDTTDTGTAFGGYGQAIYGLPFYLANSVMYDLANEEDGYTSYFVSAAPIDTSSGSYDVTSSMHPQGIAGVISGSGAFHVGAGGAAQLSEANTYTGATIVDRSGLLILLGPVVSIASSSDVQADGMLDVSGVVSPVVSIQSLSGAGVVEMGGHTLELTNASGEFSGTLSDSGLSGGSGSRLTLDAGVETLSGTNNYTGLTTINGGTLVLKGGAAIADANEVDVNAGGTSSGTLQVDDAETIGSLAGTGGAVVLNATLTTGGNDASTSYSGAISGSGGLVKTGSGVFTLGGANAYSGATVITNGALVATGGAAIGDVSAVIVTEDATSAGSLEIDDAEAIGSISGNGAVVLNAALTTGGDNTDTAFAGVISGTGALDKVGTGVFALTGANTYSGGTTIENGALVGDTVSLQGAITDNAQLTFLQDTDGAFAGAITGSGVVVKEGAGTLTLTGANTYSGGSMINEGTLAGDASSLQGDITDNATLRFVQTADGLFAGAISGTGDVVKDGAGTLRLTGANSYGGGTTVNAGTLEGDTTSLQGDIADAATVTFAQENNGVYAGVISGSGALVKDGSGTVLLTGANTYTGGTTVIAGVLQGDTTSIQGDIVNNSRVVFAQDQDGTYAGSISGTGAVTIAPSAGHKLEFSATNTYSGDTEVASGLFNLDGVQQNSRTVVDAGATLGGSGISHGILVKTGGIIAPGHSVGTLSSDGAGIQLDPGSIYHVEINSSGVSDKLVTAGAASIDGAKLLVTLEFSQAPITLADLEARGAPVHYDILEAKNGVTGQFVTALPQYVFFDSDVTSTSSEVMLSFGRNALSFSAAGGTANEQSVGDSIAGLGGNNPVYQALLVSPTREDAQSAERQLSGEIHGDVAGAVLDENAVLRDAVFNRINTRTSDAGAFWLKALDSSGITGADGNAAKVNRQLNGLSAGADTALGGDWLIGAAGAYMSSPLRTAGAGSARIDSYHFGAYTGGEIDGFSLRAAGTYDHYKARTVRQISVPNLAAIEQAHYGINQGGAFGEIGYGFVDGDATFEPFADLSWTQANLGGFVESQGPAALQARGQTVDRTQSILGARYTMALQDNETIFTPNLTLGWVRNFDGVTPNRRLGFVDGTDTNGFVVDGVTTNKDAGLVRAGLDAAVGSGFSLGAGYQGTFGARGQDQGVRLDLRFNY